MKKVTGKKRKRVGWIVLLCIVGLLVLGMAGAVLAFEPGRREAMDIVIDDVDFSRLKDGTYTGEYRGKKDNLRDTGVMVTISGAEISDIRVVMGALANEKQSTDIRNGGTINDLFARVMEHKSLQVDAISGATITSKTHLKALENALIKAQQGK